MEMYFHTDHGRKTCVAEYLNLRTESQSTETYAQTYAHVFTHRY